MSLALTNNKGVCVLEADEVAMGLILREAASGLNAMATAIGAGPDLRAFYSHYASQVEDLRGIVSFRLLASNEQARILNENRAKAERPFAPPLSPSDEFDDFL